MAYVYRPHAIEGDWEQILADVSVLRMLQVKYRGNAPGKPALEVMVADSAPEATDDGPDLLPGDTMTYDQIQYLGTSGKLYGRSVAYDASGTVIPVSIVSVSTS